MDPAVSPSDIIYANTEAHGYGIIDVTADAFTITIQEVSRELVAWSYYDEPELLYDLFWPITFTIRDGVLAQEPFVGGE